MSAPVKDPKRRYTVQEYLALEEKATDRHEFDNGEILAMSGGTFEHSQVATNLIAALHGALRGKPCQVVESNMRVRMDEAGRYVYPDATVVCGRPEFDVDDRKRTTIVNPSVVVEVLSESTEAYDRGTKFSAYRTLNSLKEYVLVSQDTARVETYFRHPDGRWTIRSFNGLDAAVTLDSLGLSIPMREIYLNVEFPTESPPEAEAPAEKPSEQES